MLPRRVFCCGVLIASLVVECTSKTVPMLRHSHQSSMPLPWKTSSSTSLPVEGNYAPYGVFYTQLSLGTPPRTFNVAIDTGSYRTIVTGSDCSSCNTSSKVPYEAYDPASSSTSSAKKSFSNSYKTCNIQHPSQTCTIRGKAYSEKFSFPGMDTFDLDFGVITSQTSNFVQFESIHGLMGMDSIGGTDNFEGGTPVMQASGGENVYAMCFQNEGHGKLTVGRADPTYYIGEMEYTPFAFDFSVGADVQSVQVGSHVVPPPRNGWEEATLDSGTNVLLLPSKHFNAIKGVFQTVASESPSSVSPDAVEKLFSGECVSLETTSGWPSIGFALNGTTLQLPPQGYLLPQTSRAFNFNNTDARKPGMKDGSTLCLAITNMGIGPSAEFIIGDTLMSQYYVEYDRKGGKIGWAKVNKDTCFN